MQFISTFKSNLLLRPENASCLQCYWPSGFLFSNFRDIYWRLEFLWKLNVFMGFINTAVEYKNKLQNFSFLEYRIYSRIGRNFFLIFFNKKHGCDLSARHTLKVFGYCKYRILRLISRYRHELRLRVCSHIPMRDSFMCAHAHATAQRALDFPALN